MNNLERLEAERDEALGELKEHSNAIRHLVEDEERVVKQNRADRYEIEKKKAAVGERARHAQAAIDALEAKVPREVVTAVSEREAKVSALSMELDGLRRELATAKYNVEQIRKRAAEAGTRVSQSDIAEYSGQMAQLEGIVAEMAEDLDEAKKSYEAVVILRREALEKIASETEGPAVSRR